MYNLKFDKNALIAMATCMENRYLEVAAMYFVVFEGEIKFPKPSYNKMAHARLISEIEYLAQGIEQMLEAIAMKEDTLRELAQKYKLGDLVFKEKAE